MKHGLLVLTVALLLSVAMPTSSASELPVGIEEDEYAVYNAALKNLEGYFDIHVDTIAVFNATRPVRRLDAAEMKHLISSGMSIDLELVDDFNQKNDRSYRIESDQLLPPIKLTDNWDPDFPSLGSERLELSRVGFDRERRHALMVISYTNLTKFRAFYSSGSYLLLEKEDAGWNVIHKAASWISYY